MTRGMPVARTDLDVPNRRNRLGLLVFGTGAAIGLHLGLLNLFLWETWTAPLVFFAASLLMASITYALWSWVFPHLGGRTRASQIARQALVSLIVFGSTCLAVGESASRLAGGTGLFGAPPASPRTITLTPELRQRWTRIYTALPVVPTVLITLIAYHQVWLQVWSLRSRERELTELAATAQLAALRSQINPHFLFNSLNSIAQLIHSDPAKAETCVERLADIFRYLLHRADQEFVPLGEELAMAQAYLEIERARFEERLEVRTHIDPRSLSQKIPNLILQPLVENAIRHGISRKLGMGVVSIDTKVEDGVLTLTVDDDGLGMTAEALDEAFVRGVGLRNLRQRLARLYGPAHQPEIQSKPGRGTTVRIRLPIPPVVEAA